MISLMNIKIPNQPKKEEYYGNREYKLLLNNNKYTRSKKEVKIKIKIKAKIL